MGDYSPEYEAFWKAYPKRNGQKRGKKPSSREWDKLNKAEQVAALVDVEKRNRNRGWGKYIKDAERYLKHAGWDDDWEPYVNDDDSKPNTGPYQPRAGIPEPELHWADRMLNRLFLNYMFATSGLDDVKPALEIKHAILGDAVPAFEEDITAERTTKRQAAHELAELFLSRLDIHYHKTAKNRVLHVSRKAA